MKSVITDGEFWFGFCVALLVVCGGAAIVAGMAFEDMKQVAMAKQGYEQVVLPGSSKAMWQKAE